MSLIGDFIGEVIGQAFVEFLFFIPGGVIRWLFFLCKKPLKIYIENGKGWNFLIMLSIMVIIIYLLKTVF